MAWLARTIASDGFARDPVDDLAAVLADPAGAPRRELYKLGAGSDVWHTITTLRALRAWGAPVPAASTAALRELAGAGGLPHWRARPALCWETTAAWALVDPERAPALAALARRHALPGGTWAAALLEAPGGHAHYATGPSVTGWVLPLLAPDEPLAVAGRAFVARVRAPDGGWHAHDAFYGTPLYAAHVCAAVVEPAPLRAWLDATTHADGGHGFGPHRPSSVLPTAWALLARLRAGQPADDPAVAAAAARLWEFQVEDGRFPLGDCPDAVFYTGDLYATANALLALRAVSAA